uniref:Uncharacterized protein n=2 Tax=Anguilla anguilla TaxID=7936 RepID=A0A0E9QLC0_ANGAN
MVCLICPNICTWENSIAFYAREAAASNSSTLFESKVTCLYWYVVCCPIPPDALRVIRISLICVMSGDEVCFDAN